MAECFLNQKWLERNFYCTKSIISKFAVHRHFNSTLSHKGNIMQEYIEFASAKLCVHCGLGKPTPGQIKAGSELRSA